jgi:NADH:ubiquinone oxidoreductase subunit K
LSIILVFNNCISQSFKKYELKRLNAFKIKNETTDIYNSENYLYLKDILEKEQKQITRKTGGIIFTSLSILITALGARIYSNSRNAENGIGQSIGTLFMAVGIVELGISIPIFISSNKRQKERDKLIESYKIQNPQN